MGEEGERGTKEESGTEAEQCVCGAGCSRRRHDGMHVVGVEARVEGCCFVALGFGGPQAQREGEFALVLVLILLERDIQVELGDDELDSLRPLVERKGGDAAKSQQECRAHV